MAFARLATGLVLVALLVGVVAGLLFLADLAEERAGAATPLPVRVVVERMDGTVRYSGDVEAATPLGALLAAARDGAFDVEVDEYPNGAYVRAIAGEEARGVAGWVYAVADEAGATHPGRAADRFELGANATVRWHWTEEPLPGEDAGPTGSSRRRS